MWKKKACDDDLSPILRSFEGEQLFGVGGGFIPPDPVNAVGTHDIVSVINSGIVINSKSTLVQTYGDQLDNFFGAVGATGSASRVFDPWIVYDQYEDRYVLVGLQNVGSIGYMYMAVSKSGTFSNPPVSTDWWLYRMDRTGPGGTFPDYEKLGYDQDAYYITGNDFVISTGSYSGVSLFAIDKTAVLSGPNNSAFATYAYDQYNETPQRINDFSMFPVQCYDNPTPAMYFASAAFGSGNIRLYTFTDVLTTPTLSLQDVTVNAWSTAPDVPQPSPPVAVPLDVASPRIMSGVLRNERVWVAHTIVDPAEGSGRTLVRWYSFDVSNGIGFFATDQQETISNTPIATDRLFYSHINVDSCNNMAIGCSIAGPSTFGSIAYTGRSANDPPNTTRPVILAKAGEETYEILDSSGRNRWGDYSGLSLDPRDQHTMWLFNEYALLDNINSPSRLWKTWTGAFTVGCCFTPMTPSFVTTITSGLIYPWGLVFLPNGDAIVTERNSKRVLLVEGSAPHTVTEIYDFAPDTQFNEGGLLGVEISPNFGSDNYLFFYLTIFSGSTPIDNTIVRATYIGGVLGGFTTILSGIPAGSTHNGGRLRFGPDGYLYVSTGDSGNTSLPQNTSSFAGKILRIQIDGTPAPGNPFIGMAGADEVWSYGHRNVQGLTFDDTGRLWASEFGQNAQDELNLIVSGGNYGWPTIEGNIPFGVAGFIYPEQVWSPADASPSGIVYAGGSLWMAALRGERLWRIDINGAGAASSTDFFVGTYGRLRTVELAPDGKLWVLTNQPYLSGSPDPADGNILVFELQ